MRWTKAGRFNPAAAAIACRRRVVRLSSLGRRLLFVSLAWSGASDASSAIAGERPIRVMMDYARLVRLPDGAETLVVGNPLIADVNIVKGNLLFVISGRSYGTTNVIVLDRAGHEVGESIITVVPAEDKVIVQRGAHRESLSCNPKCVTTVDLGDDLTYQQGAISSFKAHEGASAK